MKSALVILADGFEEMEAVTAIDVLRRAGTDVTVAGLTGDPVRASRGVVVVPDVPLADVADQTFDLTVLPGGMPGAANLRDDRRVVAIVKRALAENRAVGAICAAPSVVLASQGLLAGRRATAHPEHVNAIEEGSRSEQRVVVDENLITSRGPGTALEWALALVARLFGEERAAEVARPMVVG